MNKIITIGREFGSGGRELGRRLAEKLGYQYYDREIITRISEKTSLSEEYVNQVLEQTPNHLFPITTGYTMVYNNTFQLKQIQDVYSAQCELLKELATKENCIIVGRCADYLLKEFNPFRIFVYADIESRINRCEQRRKEGENFTRKQLKKMILKIDKERAKYYDFITGDKWGDRKNYDLCLNTSNVEIKQLVPVIAKLFED